MTLQLASEMDGFGTAAKRLLASNMDPNCLRTNGTMLKDEWQKTDDTVKDIMFQELRGMRDLLERGLTYPVEGLKTTVVEWQRASDIGDAQLSMVASTRSDRDRPTFDQLYLPLPIAHKDFSYDIRELASSRSGAKPLDTYTIELATQAVAELQETTLFNGTSSFNFGGGIIYGYTDFPQRNTVTLSDNWDSTSKTGEEILVDVQAMIQANVNDRHYGPFILYYPTAYTTVLGNDFKANSDKSIKSRLMELDEIEDIRKSDFLTADNVLLVEMQKRTVDIVDGMAVQPVEWEGEGGMVMNFKVMGIQIPRMKADKAGRSGICHLS